MAAGPGGRWRLFYAWPVRRSVILYDRECGFCRWSLDRVLVWDKRGRLRPVALQDAEADSLLDGMDAERKMASWHLVTPKGRVHSAGAAVPPLLRLLPGGRPVAAVAEVFSPVTGRGYRWAAEHRELLGRLVRRRR